MTELELLMEISERLKHIQWILGFFVYVGIMYAFINHDRFVGR